MSEAKVREVSRQSEVVQRTPGTIRSAGSTHPGYRREQNEDAYWADEQKGIWVVADGLGGHHAGELASKTVVEEIAQSASTDRHYERALQKAHALLLGDEHSTANMGSTAVVLAEEGDYFHIYWVGDSRAYLWTPNEQNGEFSQLTSDHSYVQMLMDSGAINSEEAANHPNRHVITRCIGGSTNPKLEVDRVSYRWAAGQKLLLCSDGLSSEVANEKITRIIAENTDNQRIVDLLISAALDAGGKDNITVQIIDAPPQAPTFITNPNILPEDFDQAREVEANKKKIWQILSVLLIAAGTIVTLAIGLPHLM
ncbi:protein phosphatase 2C domain-containing protein [Microbulbifer sp. MLAF003]|uniref:PP2C family protein-serine/threonine phosphatase n=1 Tax=unclassified Microbulbifer TaxID=2619833 RepID=UPI0024AD040F|nr:protein phosphatase 2C domain-containing protein [Microbulbifer sp. MLAF003]WHI53034.1 protein phosphatase 2C domain-containing protein [Microbulbifer sp. MLAF003]